jgi:hypothetical protein
MADKRKKGRGDDEGPVDLASRIGARSSEGSGAEGAGPAEDDVSPSTEDTAGAPPEHEAAPRAPIERLVAPADDDAEKSAPILSVRGAPTFGEVDLVVTPLPTPDDWHRFELALRKVKGVAQLRPEYYRHGVAKMRVTWEGRDRLANVLRSGIPGYRVRVIGEDRATIQILVSSGADERRPG